VTAAGTGVSAQLADSLSAVSFPLFLSFPFSRFAPPQTGWKRSHPLIRALYRGVGVHHGGLVKQYRDLVETLFRGKHLKVVVSTSSLALGINMPARSVTLCGDSKLLTPLQYRQMSGRAGRRGYDNIGHVIFFAVPPRKIFRLLKSPLNSLRGHLS
jgi:superfamily II RNA helicase